MEPLFFKAENLLSAYIRPSNTTDTSMEPLFFKAENSCVASTTLAAISSDFNGAAFFQSGKCLFRVTRYVNT